MVYEVPVAKKAQLFVINAVTGALIKILDTGVGSTTSPNGLGGVQVVRNATKANWLRMLGICVNL